MIAHEISIRNIVLGSVKPKDYCDNSIQTNKYNVFTFLPLALFEQFQKVANLYFLFISCLMLIGTYTMLFDSPLSPWSTLIILGLVIIISLVRTGYEDYQRHVSDAVTNTRTISVFNSKQENSYNFKTVEWREIQVGDIVRLEKNQEIPADMLLISTSEEEGLAFVETSNIDGETNLKLKTSVSLDKIPSNAFNNLETFKRVEIVVKCEQPNSDIHNFNGSVYANGREVGVDASSLLLRGSSLRNTKHAIGIVVYTGKETKLVMNSRRPPSKESYIEKIMNQIIVVILWCQIGLAAISAVLYYIWLAYHIKSLPYLCYDTSLYTNTLLSSACDNSDNYSSFGYFFSFFILYSNFIPISLYVTVEICNYFQAFFINSDILMYDEQSDTPALARTSNMNSDLGMVEYIFSDKTGTLTDNVMKFKRCSIAGTVYGDSPVEDTPDAESESSKVIRENLKVIKGRPVEELGEKCRREMSNNNNGDNRAHADFVLLMALCHTVIVDTENTSNGSSEQQQQLVSESPDEEALVKAAQTLGMTFVGRSPGRVNLIHQQQSSGSSSSSGGAGGVSVSYELLATIPFDSTRKRMSVVIRRPDGSLVVYCKGADNIIFERATHFVDSSGSSVPVSQSSSIRDTLVMHLDCFASDGLRTLVLAKKELSPDVYSEFSKIWSKAERSLNQRQAYMQQAAELVESGLTVMGATAIEDKLQQGVASTIADLRAAGIKLWVLTGDKMETAINIGYSSRLLMPNMILIKLAYKGEDTMSVRRKLGTLLHHFQTLAEEHSDFFKKWISRKKTFYQDINTGDGSTSGGGAAEEEGTGGAGGGEGGEGRENEPMFDPIQEGSPLLEKSSKAPSVGQITCDHLGLVVDGETLIRIFSDTVSEQLFLALSMICRSVIACRVSPEQKRLIVRLVQRGVTPTPVTLSIGDGANDVAMIQEAQIGVGISGKEGRQAVNNSDFAIAQFRFLRRLLLIHGRLDYRRICKVVEYSFYKNIVSTIVVFFFTFFSAYSGQSLFEDSIHAVYNVVLAWPVIGFGIFDRDISEKTLLQHNFLYLSGRKRLDLNIGTMLYSMLQAVLDGVIIYFVPYYVYRQSNDVWNSPDFNGYSAGLWVFGTTVYCCLMGAMFVKLYGMTCTWTWLSHLFYWGSIVLFIIFLIWYQYWIDWSYWYYGVTFEMASSSTFWYLLWLVPTASYLMSSTFVMVQKEFFPTVVDIGTEFDQDASSLPLLPSWLWSTTSSDASESDPLTGSKTLLPAEFDELMQTLLTIGSSKYIMDWENIKLYWSSFMASEQANLGLLNTSTTNRAESTFNFDHLASNYNSSASDSHVVHISAALLFPIQYVAKLAANSSITSSSSAATSPAPFSSDSSEAVESKEDLKSII